MKNDEHSIRKMESFLDIFKGTCELNNFNPCIKEPSEASNDKCYFGGLAADSKQIELKAFIKDKDNLYRKAEIINLAVKTLNNANIYDFSLNISSDDKDLCELIELVDIEFTSKKDTSLSFDIVLDGKVLASYKETESFGILEFFYDNIEDAYSYDEVDVLDVYIAPKSLTVLPDAFAIATNLKDAGFKVEVNYEMEKKDITAEIADFLISFDEKDIGDYKVKMKDLKTNETHDVMIDNIVEELSFI